MILFTILKMTARALSMFIEGKDFNIIKSLCLVDLANNFHDQHKIDNAIRYYTKSAYLNPKNYYAYAGLTAAFLEKKLFNQAVESGNKAINIRKPDIQMNVLLLIAYESVGDTESSKKTLHQIVEYFGNVPAAYNHLAHIYFKLGLYDQAEYYCKEAIRLDEARAGLHYNLATIYKARNEYSLALNEYRRVLELKADRKYTRLARKEIEKLHSGSP